MTSEAPLNTAWNTQPIKKGMIITLRGDHIGSEEKYRVGDGDGVWFKITSVKDQRPCPFMCRCDVMFPIAKQPRRISAGQILKATLKALAKKPLDKRAV